MQQQQIGDSRKQEQQQQKKREENKYNASIYLHQSSRFHLQQQTVFDIFSQIFIVISSSNVAEENTPHCYPFCQFAEHLLCLDRLQGASVCLHQQ